MVDLSCFKQRCQCSGFVGKSTVCLTRAAEAIPIASSESIRVRRSSLRIVRRKQKTITFVRQPQCVPWNSRVREHLREERRRFSEMGTGPIRYNINIQYILCSVRLQYCTQRSWYITGAATHVRYSRSFVRQPQCVPWNSFGICPFHLRNEGFWSGV